MPSARRSSRRQPRILEGKEGQALLALDSLCPPGLSNTARLAGLAGMIQWWEALHSRDRVAQVTSLRRKRDSRPWGSIVLFLGPALILYSAFTLFPVFMTFFNSVHKLDMTQNLARSFVGIQNFREILTGDLIIKHALLNSVTWAFVTPFFDVGLGFLLALVLFSSKPPGARVFRTVWYIPVLFDWVVVGVLTRWIYNYEWGPVVKALRAVGLDRLAVNFLGAVIRFQPGDLLYYLPLVLLPPTAWLLVRGVRRQSFSHLFGALLLGAVVVVLIPFRWGIANIPLYSLIAMVVWRFTGWNMVIFLAALHSLPEEVLEAARIDGANYWQVLGHIIIPLLRVVIVNLYILSWIGKMMQFALVWVSTRGGPVYYTETVATYVQKRAFEWRTLDLGYPSAIAVLWFVVVFGGALLFNRILSGETIEY